MKIVKEHINEKFTLDSDPIHDMGIGIIKEIENWIKKIKKISEKEGYFDPFPDNRYRINNDLTIDVMDDSHIPNKCGNLPSYIKYGEIYGDFTADDCNLTTLRGFPKKIDDTFNCSNNKLKSLKHAPKYVGKDFDCTGNTVKFTTEDVKKVCKVKGNIYC